MTSMIPRTVAFKNGKAITAGITTALYANQPDVKIEVMELPTSNPDFLGPIQVKDKTKEEIQQSIKDYMEAIAA